MLGLLQELLDPSALAVDDAQRGRQLDGLADSGHRRGQARIDVVLDHLGEVHAVDVVRADDDDVLGLFIVDDVQGLVDRVRAAQVPVRTAALLSGNRGDEVAEKGGRVPGLGDVAVKRVRLVLRQHDDLEVAGVDDIRQSEIDEAEVAAEGDRGLRPHLGQGHEPLPLAARQDYC